MREELSKLYLSGNGIEIGALCHPLSVNGTVTHIDRLDKAGLLEQYPGLPEDLMATIDVIDDGETLEKFQDESQDFVIANHFLEHCKNPLGTIENWLRVLKVGGKIYCALPDKEKSFDKNRPLTTIEHIFNDYDEVGDDWQHLLEAAEGNEEEALRLQQTNYSIHRHTWDRFSILEFLVNVTRTFHIKLRAFVHTDERDEFIFVLEKLW